MWTSLSLLLVKSPDLPASHTVLILACNIYHLHAQIHKILSEMFCDWSCLFWVYCYTLIISVLLKWASTPCCAVPSSKSQPSQPAACQHDVGLNRTQDSCSFTFYSTRVLGWLYFFFHCRTDLHFLWMLLWTVLSEVFLDHSEVSKDFPPGNTVCL